MTDEQQNRFSDEAGTIAAKLFTLKSTAFMLREVIAGILIPNDGKYSMHTREMLTASECDRVLPDVETMLNDLITRLDDTGTEVSKLEMALYYVEGKTE